MAEIATYRCSRNLCRFEARVCRDFPVWHSHTPRNLRSISIRKEARHFVTGYRSESLCYRCKKVVAYTSGASCPMCKSPALPYEHLGKRCPACEKGELLMPNLAVYE